ncbi:peptidase S8 [Parashewanella curva]|uniref:Peptidase S8 n=1 Tax=Parashewanella curva TaxID=2338552 RepID=A0A3L8PWW6_9GAMM|nr:S8 family serine peptidase [Parashewanella curva]RLV59810.1 peptidase S8 [Parashewanella curva]
MTRLSRYKMPLLILIPLLSQAPAIAGPLMASNKANTNQITTSQYIIKFKDKAQSQNLNSSKSVGLSSEQLAANIIHQLNITSASPLGEGNAYTSKLSERQLKELKNNPNVEYIEPDYPKYLYSQHLGQPTDRSKSRPTDVNWEPVLLHSNDILDSDTGNRTVCIIDSGYAINHPSLISNNVTGKDITGTGSWDNPSISHGTHVAGIIAAMQPNDPESDIGMRGIMPNGKVNIFAVKVVGANGSIMTSDVIKAVNVCKDNHANVISMSLGGFKSSKLEEQTYKEAQKAGILLVAAAGNNGGTDNSYPASYPEVMSVASVDSKMAHSAFSQSNAQIEISAPGEAVLSSVIPKEGRIAELLVNQQSYFPKGVVPTERYVPNDKGSYNEKNINDFYAGKLLSCQITDGKYNCRNMTDDVCLIQRLKDQQRAPNPESMEERYPEINPIMACQNAGAKAAIIYSSDAYPGLQNPFLIDSKETVNIPTVSVSKDTGDELLANLGQWVTVNIKPQQDFQYENGTSMATPYVAAVSALVWSKHPECTAAEVRKAIDASATHLGANGRNHVFGFGLINGQNLDKLLGQSCGVN